MRRRDFLVESTMAMGAAATGLWGRGSIQAAQGAPGAKLDRVAIMAYSFVRVLKVPGQPASAEKTLEVFDIPQMFADRYKVHNIEMQHNYFESTDPAFFKSFLDRCAKTKSKITNINLELGTMNISSPNPVLRAQAVDLTKAWVDHAVALGSPRVMINQGKLTEENKAAAIAALRQMTAYAKTKNIMVGVEPRNDDFVRLTEVIKAAGAYSNPDIGNFGGDQAQQHAGIKMMFPITDGTCHIKAHNPPTYDLVAALQLIKQLGYTGLYSIENEQTGDPYQNVQTVLDVVLANI